jgi:hypothetical protein
MPVTVEYLLVVKASDAICTTEASFTRLLCVPDTFQVKSKKASFDDFSCRYKVTTGLTDTKDQRFFQIEFTADDLEKGADYDKFATLLKCARTSISKLGGTLETLWDDISFHYSRRAYDDLHRIENLLRKLISNFFVMKLGENWLAESTPKEVQGSLNSETRKDRTNALHRLDFIQLTSFLLHPYSKTESADLLQMVKKAKSVDDLKAVQEELPQSNWQRYLSKVVECEDGYLESRWRELYELLCKVAHNALFSKKTMSG